MKNHNEDVLSFKVLKYQIAQSKNERYNSDWLDTILEVKSNGEHAEINLELWSIEEFERIVSWLHGILENKNKSRSLDFVDSSIRFKLLKRSKRDVLKVIYWNWSEDKDKVVWELIINKENILDFIGEIQSILLNFPCRCGFEH